MQEQEIIDLLCSHDPRGAEELLRHYGPLMRYIIRPILENLQDQEDCISEVSIRVWNKIELYDPQKGSWKAWLTAITRNTAINHARKNNDDSQLEVLPPETPGTDPTPEESILQRERQKALRQAVSRLPQKERVLFYRKYYYLQSTAQIASEMGMTQRAVEGKLYRIRGKLRSILGGEGYA